MAGKKTVSKDDASKKSVYDEELKKVGYTGHNPWKTILDHPFLSSTLTIILIIALVSLLVAFGAFSDSIEAIVDSGVEPDHTMEVIDARGVADANPANKADVEEVAEVVVEEPEVVEPVIEAPEVVEVPEVVEEISACEEIAYTVECDGEYNDYYCSHVNDGDFSTEWFSANLCRTGRSPCSIVGNIKITSDEPFGVVKIYNPNAPQYYINRVLFTYNDLKNRQGIMGGEYIDKPWAGDLEEETTSLNINVVEIMGIGLTSFPGGVSEVKIYPAGCLESVME